MSQSATIYGKVTDEKGEELIGASIYIEKAEASGTDSDVSGLYEISIPAKKNVKIIFTYTGYSTQVIESGKMNEGERTKMDVVLLLQRWDPAFSVDRPVHFLMNFHSCLIQQCGTSCSCSSYAVWSKGVTEVIFIWRCASAMSSTLLVSSWTRKWYNRVELSRHRLDIQAGVS